MSAKKREVPENSPAEHLARLCRRFHDLLGLNSDCLQLLAALQQDLQCGLPRHTPLRSSLINLYEKLESVVSNLNFLCDDRYLRLFHVLDSQRRDVLRSIEGQGRQGTLSSRVLGLKPRNPDSLGFRPGRCKSAHDVLCFAHERAIEAMFSLSDRMLGGKACVTRRLVTSVPLALYIVDLGGGFEQEAMGNSTLDPAQVSSRPFRALWRGLTYPGVAWRRTAPPSLGGLASVLAGALAEQPSAKRSLGDRSYLLVSGEYMNLNARMAYHFSMVDASVSDDPNDNHVTFRFAGGGARRSRRNLRASFIQSVLQHYGFWVDRREDLVYAWTRKVEASEVEIRLDILGRLMACACQLDMYLSTQETARWHIDQFIAGNYNFQR